MNELDQFLLTSRVRVTIISLFELFPIILESVLTKSAFDEETTCEKRFYNSLIHVK